MIYDCFTFFNELDLLEIRLNILNDVVDKFVLVEMNKTHTGSHKPFIFDKNKARFAKFLDKIIHIKVDTYPHLNKSEQDQYGNKWILENYQRDQIMQGLKEAKDDDVVIISDVDEIPNPECIKNYKSGIQIFEQKNFYYFLNCLNITDPILKWGSKIGHFSDLKDPKVQLPQNARYIYSEYGQPTYFRCCMKDNHHVTLVPNGGWHFSFVMDINRMILKRKSIVEQQFNTNKNMSYDYIKKCVLRGKDLFGRDYKYQPIPLDNSFPKYLLENQEKYKHLIFKITWKYHLNLLLTKIKHFLFHKEKKENGRRKIYLFGIKVLSYKKKGRK